MDSTTRLHDLIVGCAAIRPGAVLPRKGSEGASGFDLHACLEQALELPPGGRALVPTGLIMAIPPGYEGNVRARSGLALRCGIGLVNGPGTIDSDYRGEVGVILANWGGDPVTIRPGDRIAQIVFLPVPRARVEWAQVDVDTARGAGGFGHTGMAPLSSPSSSTSSGAPESAGPGTERE